jgi:CrcB protein
MKIAWIAAGGALGAVLRWLLATAVQTRVATNFPLGTLAVNVLGCAAIGALAAWFTAPGGLREETRLFLVVGVLGGFTTMSAFAWESVSLATASAPRARCSTWRSATLCVGAAVAFAIARAARGWSSTASAAAAARGVHLRVDGDAAPPVPSSVSPVREQLVHARRRRWRRS